MTRPPAPRYKVVERGRRLEVIDTQTGRPASSHASVPLVGAPKGRAPERSRDVLMGAPAARSSAEAPQRSPAGLDNGNVFTTRRWYDEKAPRTIKLNFTTRKRIDGLRFGIAIAAAIGVALSFWWWPVFPVLVVGLAAAPKSRKNLRAAVTRFVDTLDQAA